MIRANGTANLFLINPNGIIFGHNASLNIGGSLISSTADSLNFADGTHFSATNPSAPSLLTISVPIGLQFGKASELIVARSQAIDTVDGSLAGLKVQSGNTLAFVGGNINIQGGILVAPEGHIELGSVAGDSLVSLQPIEKSWTFRYEGVQNFKDIQINEAATIGANGQGGGDVHLQGRHVTLAEGSQVFATVTEGVQPGGTLRINATEAVELIGTGLTEDVTGLATTTLSAGDAGNIVIDTRRLIVQNGAGIATNSAVTEYSPGIVIQATGRAGNLTINASDFIKVSNDSKLTTETSGPGNAGNLRIETGKLIVQNGSTISSVADEGSTGNGGDLTIKARQLNVSDGASVTASSLGVGNAGNLLMTSDLVKLDQGTLNTQTKNGEGGVITIQGGSIQLRNNSLVSTQASGIGNGGNININLDTLIGAENSNIKANAFRGRGGDIQITTQGLFLFPHSDITASSQLGINGTVQINTLGINPNQGLVNLPVQPVNVTGLIAQGCPTGVGPGANKFVVTGRGGLPPTPREALSSEQPLADLGTIAPGRENRTSAATSTKRTGSEPAPLVEAQGWVTNAKGEVVLVAQAPTVTPNIPWLTPTICHAP